jgi:acyl-CoA hydrolase
MWSRSPAGGISRGRFPHPNSCYFTMVAVDIEGRRPVEIPALHPRDSVEVKRFEAARRRRDAQRQHCYDPR